MNNILFTKASFFRNLKDYKFVQKLSQEKKDEIIEKLTQLLPNFKLVQAKDIDEKTIKFLSKNHLQSNSKTMFVDTKNNVLINLFETEHIEICAKSFDCGKSAYKKVKEVADLLANSISLAYSDNYGFLMSDITKIGSGLSLTSEICLPCIENLGKIEQIKQNLKKLGYTLSETKLNSIYTLSTMCNLGVKEKDIIEDFEKMLTKLQDIEIESAKMLDVGSHDEIMDKSLRSFAILKSAYLLTGDELNSLLLNVRIGLNLQMLEVDINKMNKLQSLVYNKKTDFISQSELKKLAEQVQEILKGE